MEDAPVACLRELHSLVVRQQAALPANDLEWFQKLVQQRIALKDQLSLGPLADLLPGRDVAADIVAMGQGMGHALRAMVDSTSARLRALSCSAGPHA